jgi:hypothetical protein
VLVAAWQLQPLPADLPLLGVECLDLRGVSAVDMPLAPLALALSSWLSGRSVRGMLAGAPEPALECLVDLGGLCLSRGYRQGLYTHNTRVVRACCRSGSIYVLHE